MNLIFIPITRSTYLIKSYTSLNVLFIVGQLMHTVYTHQQLDIPAVLDNTLIAAVLSPTFFSCACWLVTAITCTETLTNWVDSYFSLL